MTPAGRATSNNRLSAVAKVVAIVEATAREGKLSRIAEGVNLPVSTVHRILQELVALSWVRADAHHGYVLDTRLVALAAKVNNADALLRVATPVLRSLQDATGHTVHMAVRQGDSLVYLAKLDGRSAYQMRSHVGLTVPMHSTGVGKAFLAALPDAEVRALAKRTGLPRRTPNTIVDVGELLAHLETVRARGFVIDDEENEEHVRCVAALVVDHAGNATAAISVSSLTFELDEARLRHHAKLLVDAAAEIARQLGAPEASGPATRTETEGFPRQQSSAP